MALFEGCQIVLELTTSVKFKEKAQLRKDITSNGGVVSFIVTKKVIDINLCRYDLRNKISVPMFYRRIKLGTSSGANELKQEFASKSALITRTRKSMDILFCNKMRVPMFYFDSKTARPIVPL